MPRRIRFNHQDDMRQPLTAKSCTLESMGRGWSSLSQLGAQPEFTFGVVSCNDVKRRKCLGHFRRQLARIIILVSSICLGHAQPSNLSNSTFTNLSGRVYSNVNVLKIEKDEILFRYGDEFRYDRVKLTNLAESVQLQFGYDLKRIARE